MSLYITCSRGLFKYDFKKKKIKKIISIYEKGLFKKPSKGFFGISKINKKILVVASRENFSNVFNYAKSTDLILHFYDILNCTIIKKIKILNIFDSHQIFYFHNKIFITETGKNQVQIYCLKNNCVIKKIFIGKIRKDINHVNSVYVGEEFTLIGLNNGNKNNFNNAQLIKIKTNIILDTEEDLNVYNKGEVINLVKTYHSHDIEYIHNNFYVSASESGEVFQLNPYKKVFTIERWTRGITSNDKYIYIGKSGTAKRFLRHTRYYGGSISVLDKNSKKIIETINIPRIGQLNDIMYMDDNL